MGSRSERVKALLSRVYEEHGALLSVNDLRDFAWLEEHQEKLQGKYDCRAEFASTPGGQCALHKMAPSDTSGGDSELLDC